MRLAPSTDRKHRYQTCTDEDCELPYCRIYKEGFAAGHAAGFASGYSEGAADGYAQGYAEGHADAGE
jgi:flagellar biosynthesis/type III secretory pathway protein FliH